MTLRLSRRHFVGAGAATLASPAWAACPDKTIRIAVTFAAGGASGIVARVSGEQLAEKLGQPVIIDNKPGAGGSIGRTNVVQSPADGYTLMLSNSTPISSSPRSCRSSRSGRSSRSPSRRRSARRSRPTWRPSSTRPRAPGPRQLLRRDRSGEDAGRHRRAPQRRDQRSARAARHQEAPARARRERTPGTPSEFTTFVLNQVSALQPVVKTVGVTL